MAETSDVENDLGGFDFDLGTLFDININSGGPGLVELDTVSSDEALARALRQAGIVTKQNDGADQATNHTSNAPTFVNVTEQQKEQFVAEMKNKNTVRKTESALKQFRNFLMQPPRSEGREINNISATELDNYIGSFLLSMRKCDGTDYEPDTLTSYHRSIDRFLRESKYPHSILIDREFSTSRTVLASKRKELKQKGKGSNPNAAEPLTETEEQILTDRGIVGMHSPRALTNKMWLQNTVMLGLRGGTENRKMCWGDIALKQNELSQEYLEFSERDTKTRTGETTHQRAFRPKIFATPNDPENCPVNAYKTFESHRPPSMKTPDSPFYLAANLLRKPDAEIWYKMQPLGENSLRKLMRNMASKAGLTGRKTNHSARKTTCTKLLHAGVAPTTIQQLTGHKNVQSVNKYAVASTSMQKSMSDILCNQQPQPHLDNRTSIRKAVADAPESSRSLAPVSTEAPSLNLAIQEHVAVAPRTHMSASSSSADLLRSASLTNCTINVSYNYSSSVPSRKRTRVIESSSDSE